MRFYFILVLLALVPLSSALSTPIFCISEAKLNSTMYACLQNGEDAVFVQNGFCTVVICAQKSASTPKPCLSPTALDSGIQKCISNGLLADIYGNASCDSVRCDARPGTRGAATGNATASSTNGTIVDELTAFGNKYGSILGTVAGGMAAVGAALIGWYLTRKKKSKMGQYLTDIDDTYSTLKMNEKECEAQLHKLKHSITEDLKKGSIEESTYEILENRINGYLDEIHEHAKSDRAKLRKSKKTAPEKPPE